VKLTGAASFGGRFGPWVTAHGVKEPDHLPGRVCARVLIDHQSGLVLAFATHRFGSWIGGWYPMHRRCTANAHRLRCPWSWLPEVRLETHPVTAPNRVMPQVLP
jgi:hypothetical protein